MDDGTPITPAAHHWLWLRLLCNTDIKKLLIIAPPESAKTTWIISAYLGCYIGFWPENNIIISSSSGGTATERSLSLRAMVATEEWQKTFPGILPLTSTIGMKSAPGQWSVAPGGVPFPGRIHPTVRAIGPDSGSSKGSRANRVITDDLVDLENSYSSGQRQKIDNFIYDVLMSRLKARVGGMACIGTAQHWDDSYSRMAKFGGWVICKMKILYDSPEVYADLFYPDSYKGERLGVPVSGAAL